MAVGLDHGAVTTPQGAFWPTIPLCLAICDHGLIQQHTAKLCLTGILSFQYVYVNSHCAMLTSQGRLLREQADISLNQRRNTRPVLRTYACSMSEKRSLQSDTSSIEQFFLLGFWEGDRHFVRRYKQWKKLAMPPQSFYQLIVAIMS